MTQGETMSGGSYNYFYWNLTLSYERVEGLIDMLARLEDLAPNHPATGATRDLVALLTDEGVEHSAKLDSLLELWHAVEWVDSGDWGENQLQEALETSEKAFKEPSITPLEEN
jgi:hypothetical protein